MKTSAPCTALAWMKTTSPDWTLPKPSPLSANLLWTTSFTTLVLSARASVRLASCSSSSSWSRFLSASRSSLLTATSVFTSSFLCAAHQELDHLTDLGQLLESTPRRLWVGTTSADASAFASFVSASSAGPCVQSSRASTQPVAAPKTKSTQHTHLFMLVAIFVLRVCDETLLSARELSWSCVSCRQSHLHHQSSASSA